MRFLITGAAGFIGSHLTDRLVAASHDVWCVDNFTTGREDNLPDGVVINCDIVDREHLYRVANVSNPDIVIHCAASYSDPNKWHRDTDTNIAGTINAINVARHHDAKLIYFQTALPPISSYAISKIAAEQYIAISGVSHLIFRLANIYGPRNVSGPIPTFYKRLTAGEPCTVVQTERDMVFIQDLVDLVTDAIAREATGKYDVCSGLSFPIIHLYRSVCDALGIEPDAKEVPAPEDDVKQMELNAQRALVHLGWHPTTPFQVGVRNAVDWYREHGVTETHTHLALKG